jgi:nucleoside-diphosphate-sugar epimerase
MEIGILGATSEIAKDLILSFSANNDHELTLFARHPQLVMEWCSRQGILNRHRVKHVDEFYANQKFDALINFIGVGNPAQAAAMGASILDVTFKYDRMVLEYLQKYPNCRYIFLSSGAVFGSNFYDPVDENTPALINKLRSTDWYGVAKLEAECRHRLLPKLPIVDIRVFNYFSHTQDMDARFLITDIVRAIKEKVLFKTSEDNIVRDFLHSSDFSQLISRILLAPQTNCVIDCYSQAPIDKSLLLKILHEKFGLQYKIVPGEFGTNATGKKPLYYSLNRKAAEFGYQPQYSSLDGVCKELDLYLRCAGKVAASDA